MVVIQTLFTNLTLLWHIHVCWRVCSPTVIFDWFPVILRISWRVPHVGQEMLTPSGTPHFTPLGVHDFTHSLYIHYILLNLSVLGLWLWVHNSGFCLLELVWLLCHELIYYTRKCINVWHIIHSEYVNYLFMSNSIVMEQCGIIMRLVNTL